MIIGDFNNVLNVKDKIDGNLVQEMKFKDLECMIKIIRLYEHDTTWNYFTGQTNMYLVWYTLELIERFEIENGM